MKKYLLIIFLFTLVSFPYVFAAPPYFITITSPQDGSYLNKTVLIEAKLTQIPNARSVKFYIDNNLVGEDTTSPYQYSWDTTTYSDGTHTIYTSILQAPERPEKIPTLILDSPKITVTVDNTPPSVEITSPLNNSILTGAITLESTAQDNFGIKKVEFKIDDTLLKEFIQPPYT